MIYAGPGYEIDNNHVDFPILARRIHLALVVPQNLALMQNLSWSLASDRSRTLAVAHGRKVADFGQPKMVA
jgi:hypothetical protein